MINHYEAIARRKLGGDETWRAARMEMLPGDIALIEGGPTVPLRTGKHKGRPKWTDATIRRVTVARSEYDAEVARWEAETGKCSRCEGSGEVCVYAHRDGTRKYGKCDVCNGTGKPKGAGE